MKICIYNAVKLSIFILFLVVFLSSLLMLDDIGEENMAYSRKDATGFKVHQATQFFYFYKNLSLFPLAVEKDDLSELIDDQAFAKRFVYKNPDKLRMEIGHWYRFGESARILALYPSYLVGDPIHSLSIKPLSFMLFIVSGLFFFMACYKYGGILVSLVVSSFYFSSPFLLSETFLNDNIFSVQPLLHILSISVFFIFSDFCKKVTIPIIVFFSLVSALFSEVRGENITLIIVPLVYIFLCFESSLKHKVMLVLLVFFVFFGCKFIVREYFQDRYENTYKLVKQVGGVPFDGMRTEHHPIWHPLLAGLGDYGKDKGFYWSDREIFYKVLLKAGFTKKEVRDISNTYYDSSTKYYYKRPETLGDYSSLARNEFLTTVMSDPLWYGNILIKRVFSIINDVPPVTFYIEKNKVELDYRIVSIVLVFLGFWFSGKEYIFKFSKVDAFIIFSSLAMSITVLLVHSGKGATYSSIFPLMIMMILLGKILPKIISISKFSINKSG